MEDAEKIIFHALTEKGKQLKFDVLLVNGEIQNDEEEIRKSFIDFSKVNENKFLELHEHSFDIFRAGWLLATNKILN